MREEKAALTWRVCVLHHSCFAFLSLVLKQQEGRSGQLEKQVLWVKSVLREGMPIGLQTPPVARPPRDGETTPGPRTEDGVLALPDPHRVRVVELKPHKSIQVIRGHPYKGEMGVSTLEEREPVPPIGWG